MNKYTDIETQTAKNMLESGFNWIVRNEVGILFVYYEKPSKVDGFWYAPGHIGYACEFVPIFQNIRFDDKEPTSLESILHPQILDDAERKYLSAFIKPFRNEVTIIRKDKDLACNTTRLRIVIYVSNSGYCYLPWFNSGTMYKGMELCKAYTLEELGL